MKYCKSCGAKLDDSVKFCTECGNQLIVVDNNTIINNNTIQTQPVNQVETPEEHKAGNTLGIISLCLYFGGPLITFLISFAVGFGSGISGTSSSAYTSITTLLSSLSGISGLAAYVLMIIGRVKYPKNTLCKVVMWIYIGFLILGILSVILLFAFCYITCSTMDLSGCN